MGPSLQRTGPPVVDLSPHRRSATSFSKQQTQQIKEVILRDRPADHGLSGGWTRTKLKTLCQSWFGLRPSDGLLSKTLHALGLSYRKSKKLLTKANTQARQTYIQQFDALYQRMVQGQCVLVYIDEAHFHRDLDLGYTWGPRGQPTWACSAGAPLADRINWYGAYDFENGQCLIYNEGQNNGENTASFLGRVAQWLGPERAHKAVIIWDNAPAHVAKTAQNHAQQLGMQLKPLPSYSPDLNPIEGLWKWMREHVTQNTCYKTTRELFDACKSFVEKINKDPDAIISRLWPIFQLDPEKEKLRVST